MDYDIIYFSLFRWNGPYSSISIALAREFSRARRVFYINNPFTLKDSLSSDPQIETVVPKVAARKVTFQPDKAFSNLISITPPFTYPINFLPEGMVYNKISEQNSKVIYNTVQETIDRYDIKKYVFINCFNPFYAPVLPDTFSPILNIYQCVDDISQEEYIARHGVRLENEAVKKADLTLVTSQELYRLKSPFTKNIHYLNNAADNKNFSRAVNEDFARPTEIANIKSKIIGFIGNLDETRIDYNLLKAIAVGHPDKQLVLIGPLNNTQYKTLGLDKMSNITFTGAKAIEELPAYLKYFDVCIIPFSKNLLTKSIYPLKINEYLAAGKSVVSTDFSPDIASFRDFIHLSNSQTDFVNLIDWAISDNSADKIIARTKKAATNTWENRISEFEKLVEPFLQKKKKQKRDKREILKP